MDPITIGMIASGLGGLLGGLFGSKRQYVDPEFLRQTFGAGAIAREAEDLMKFIRNSPQGRDMLANAMETGALFGNEMNARAAASGMDPSSGAQGAASDFAVGAANAAGQRFRGQALGQMQSGATAAAQQSIANQLQAYMADRASGGVHQPNFWDRLGAGAAALGSTLAMTKGGGDAPSPGGGGAMSLSSIYAGMSPAARVAFPLRAGAAGTGQFLTPLANQQRQSEYGRLASGVLR